MGILNVTPDSFSDGGKFLRTDDAAAEVRRMIDEGADVIDIGAESTRPGSDRVSASGQIDRLKDIVPVAVQTGAMVSIDTTRREVAAFALDAGARIVNDVSAGRDDPDILRLVAERRAGLVLMHMLGEPKTMQQAPRYDDVVRQVKEFLRQRVEAAAACGVGAERCIVDPGIGFGKDIDHNLALLARVAELAELDRPVLVGPSRKRFIGELTGEGVPAGRVGGTVAACVAARRGGANIFRVHDVKQVVQALRVADAISAARGGENPQA